MTKFVPELTDFIEQKKQFSKVAFGENLSTTAIIRHLRKEIDEIEAEPKDLEEWVGIILLAIDGAWRAGHSSHDIASKIVATFEKIKLRKYPPTETHDPDQPFEHIRESHE